MGFLDIKRYHGVARLALWLARLFGFWPLALIEMYESGYGPRGFWIRVQQEAAMAHGMSQAEAEDKYRL